MTRKITIEYNPYKVETKFFDNDELITAQDSELGAGFGWTRKPLNEWANGLPVELNDYLNDSEFELDIVFKGLLTDYVKVKSAFEGNTEIEEINWQIEESKETLDRKIKRSTKLVNKYDLAELAPLVEGISKEHDVMAFYSKLNANLRGEKPLVVEQKNLEPVNNAGRSQSQIQADIAELTEQDEQGEYTWVNKIMQTYDEELSDDVFKEKSETIVAKYDGIWENYYEMLGQSIYDVVYGKYDEWPENYTDIRENVAYGVEQLNYVVERSLERIKMLEVEEDSLWVRALKDYLKKNYQFSAQSVAKDELKSYAEHLWEEFPVEVLTSADAVEYTNKINTVLENASNGGKISRLLSNKKTEECHLKFGDGVKIYQNELHDRVEQITDKFSKYLEEVAEPTRAEHFDQYVKGTFEEVRQLALTKFEEQLNRFENSRADDVNVSNEQATPQYDDVDKLISI